MDKETIEQLVKEREAMRIVRGHRFAQGSKSGVVYVLLAFFACVIGLHNFYAGYYKKGICQLVLTLISPMCLYVPLLIVALWGMGEMLFVNKSANGQDFSGNLWLIWGLRLTGIGVLIYQLMTVELIL